MKENAQLAPAAYAGSVPSPVWIVSWSPTADSAKVPPLFAAWQKLSVPEDRYTRFSWRAPTPRPGLHPAALPTLSSSTRPGSGAPAASAPAAAAAREGEPPASAAAASSARRKPLLPALAVLLLLLPPPPLLLLLLLLLLRYRPTAPGSAARCATTLPEGDTIVAHTPSALQPATRTYSASPSFATSAGQLSALAP